MSGFDWDRKGPPRPGSGSVDHPRGIERPYTPPKSEKEQRELAKHRREEAVARGRAIRRAELREFLRRHGQEIPPSLRET